MCMEEKKLKIALMIDTYFPMIDGVVMVVDNYARELTKCADVTVFCPSFSGVEFDDSTLPYKVVRCKSFRLGKFDYSIPMPRFDAKFKKALNSGEFDLIHIHSPFGVGKLGVKYAKTHKIPVVATLHSQFKQDIEKAVKGCKLLTKIGLSIVLSPFKKCDECWPVNSYIKNLFENEYKLKAKYNVLHNATDMLPVDHEEACKLVNSKYGLSEDDSLFVFTGRINVLKNPVFTCESLKLVKAAGVKFKMFFIGQGEHEDIVKKAIIDNGLEDEVRLIGRITDRQELAALYSRAQLFLFPSVYDANSLVQIEAASQGTPAVFIKGTSTASTVTDGVNGFKSEYSPEAYAEKIVEIMNDSSMLKEVSFGAKRDLYRTWGQRVSEAYKRYERLVNNCNK